MKTRYYYKPDMDQGFHGDTNELYRVINLLK